MKPFVIAVSGKGGTGKTTLSALLVKALVEAGEKPVLAVDADPNANLHEALGMEVRESLGQMREDAFTRSIPPGMSRTEYLSLRFRQVLVEGEGFDLIAMGRPEGEGCYCFANDLLQTCMRLLEKEYRFIVIDSEAGMEHISRGTIGHPDLLLIVSDPGARGMRTAARIQQIALSLSLSSTEMRLVINRSRGERTGLYEGLPEEIARIPYDPAIEETDIAGRPLVETDPRSPAWKETRKLAEQIREMAGKRTESVRFS
ncbi:MAG: AAA family ATPase [Methanolinea sp.]|nr:AAA family ATPase [Methanolinea sp.]